MWRAFNVTCIIVSCILCDVYSMWRVFYVTYIKCDVHSIWRTFDATYIKYYVHSMWRTFNMTCIQCDVHSMWRAFNVTCIQCDVTQCDVHSMWRVFNVTYIQFDLQRQAGKARSPDPTICEFDWCCFYYFLRNSLVVLLETLFAYKMSCVSNQPLSSLFLPLEASVGNERRGTSICCSRRSWQYTPPI